MKNNLKGGLLFVVLGSALACSALLTGCPDNQAPTTTSLNSEPKIKLKSEVDKTSDVRKVSDAEIIDFAKVATLDLLTIDNSESTHAQIENSKERFFSKKPDDYTGDYIKLMFEELGVYPNSTANLISIAPEVVGDISIDESNNSFNNHSERHWAVKIPLQLTLENSGEKVAKNEDVVVEVFDKEVTGKSTAPYELVISAIKLEK